jgi:hypothetical protein
MTNEIVSLGFKLGHLDNLDQVIVAIGKTIRGWRTARWWVAASATAWGSSCLP